MILGLEMTALVAGNISVQKMLMMIRISIGVNVYIDAHAVISTIFILKNITNHKLVKDS